MKRLLALLPLVVAFACAEAPAPEPKKVEATVAPPAGVARPAPVALAQAKDAKDKDKGPRFNEQEAKFVTDNLEKAVGIRGKSLKAGTQTKGDVLVTLTLEFSKDVEDKKAMRELFKSYGYDPTKPTDVSKVPLVFLVFDGDNVAVQKCVVVGVEGDLSGVKGDAFRVTIYVHPGNLNRAKKIEARLQDVAKEK